MLAQTIEGLEIKPGEWYLDATFGRGGHTQAMIDQGAHVIAFDWDSEALAYGTEMFAKEVAAGILILVHSSFANLKTEVEQVQKEKNIEKIMGILFDFGTSADQLTSGARGFSFLEDGELDMRMDTRLGVMAKDLLAVLPEKQLALMFEEFGGEHESKAVARAIKNSSVPITTTTQLATLVERVKHERRGHLHPATKVFQALRIAVNSELDEIAAALPQALAVVAPSGIIATISFHEGEDRLAKVAFRDWEAAGTGSISSKKPLAADEAEIKRNPNSRSAKLRFFRKN
jgi:16S rRNA (cytosine1402-N4)-methyltransferase